VSEQDNPPPAAVAAPSMEELEQTLALLEQHEAQQQVAEEAAPSFTPPHESPTLAALDPKRQPDPRPACAECPNSLWFSTDHKLQAFCRLMHSLTWDSEDPKPIRSCDGMMSGP